MKQWTKQAVENWVDDRREEMISDLIRIVNIRSVAEVENPSVLPFGQGCKDVLEKMLSMGRKEGFIVHNYEGYVGCISLNDKEKDVGIWAHLDVVNEGEGWQYEPYAACVKDGYVIGRGANDNKSSAIMGFYVLKFFKENKIDLSHNIRLYLGTCEEQGMYDLDYYVAHYKCPDRSLVPDSGFPVCCGERGAFNGILLSREPLSDEIIDFYTSDQWYMIPDKAVIRLKNTVDRREKCKKLSGNIQITMTNEEIVLSAKGVAANAAQPMSGVNAMQILLQEIHDKQMVSEKDDKIFSLCRRINEEYHGSALDVFCEDEWSGPMILVATKGKMQNRCLQISFISKYPVSKNEMDFPELVRKACQRYGMELEVTRYEKANYFNPKDRLAQVMTDTYNTYMGCSERPFVMSGGTYARKLPRAFACGTGMNLVRNAGSVFLPGHGDYHQPDEAILIERIQKALVIYILGIMKYCS